MNKTALEKTIEMWEVLAKTGETKEQYFKRMNIPESERPRKTCYLCQAYYAPGDCGDCPIAVNMERTWGCEKSTHFGDWLWAQSESENKKYATKFVEYLKRLPE